MTLSIIIINYNTFRLSGDCIRSVINHTKGVDYEIILVDNASSECDPGEFLKEFPRIKLVRNPENNGFAKGNNLGISHATGEYILLLNSDTIIQEDSLATCIQHMKSHPQTGVLGCRMTYPDGGIQYSARKFRSISWELLDLFRFIPMLMSYPKRSMLMLGKYFRHDKTIDCDWVNGAFFLFSRNTLNRLPGQKLDDRFFMYAEDQLWCEQVQKLGLFNVFFAGTTIIHINNGSTSVSRQLQLRNSMMKNELVIMKDRKGKGLYYYVFALIYTGKERARNMIKKIIYKLSGRLVR